MLYFTLHSLICIYSETDDKAKHTTITNISSNKTYLLQYKNPLYYTDSECDIEIQ